MKDKREALDVPKPKKHDLKDALKMSYTAGSGVVDMPVEAMAPPIERKQLKRIEAHSDVELFDAINGAVTHCAKYGLDSEGHDAKARYHEWELAVSEAMSLIELESRGCSMSGRGVCTKGCHKIGDVLGVDAESRQALREFVSAHPEEQEMIQESLEFRKMVGVAVMQLRSQASAA